MVQSAQKFHYLAVLPQEFMQSILVSDRRQKKLSVLIKFSNSIFIKFYFKAYWRLTCI